MTGHAGKRLFQMQKDDKLTDVTFNVQGSEFNGHRIVFISCGGMFEKLLKEDEMHVIENISPETFQMVFEYIYTDECDIDLQNVFELIHASKIFGLLELQKRCAELIKESLTESSIGEFTSEALQFEAAEYIQVCKEYFENHTCEVIEAEEFVDISHEVLEVLCDADSLTCSVVVLFFACVEWAGHKCEEEDIELTPENIRMVLGNILKKIRLSTLPMKDILDKIVPLRILANEDVGQLIYDVQMKENTYIESEVKVTVKGYDCGSTAPDSELSIPLSTTISELKKKDIFCGGSRSGNHYYYGLDKFTLAHDGKELSDDSTLASIYTPGQDLVLEVFTFTHNVYIEGRQPDRRESFQLTMKVKDISDQVKFNKIVRGHLYVNYDISPCRVNYITYPQYWLSPSWYFTVYLEKIEDLVDVSTANVSTVGVGTADVNTADDDQESSSSST